MVTWTQVVAMALDIFLHDVDSIGSLKELSFTSYQLIWNNGNNINHIGVFSVVSELNLVVSYTLGFMKAINFILKNYLC